MFSHSNVESEFASYAIPEQGISDVVIRVCDKSQIKLPATITPIEDDEFKTTATDGESSYFIYRRNRRVRYSKLSISPGNRQAIISICIDGKDVVSTLPRTEIRFAIMHPFFGYMFSRRMFPLHSCGLAIDGRGIVVSGASGSGKSTIGRILASRYGAEYAGDDINACSIDGRMFGMPFSRINNNREARVGAVVFLGDKSMRIDREEITNGLLESEFSMRGYGPCIDTAACVATCFANCARCYMVSRSGLTEEETASIVYDLALGRREL